MFVGKSDQPVSLNPAYANRHGLIAGATGTGKTVTLQILAEQFSQMGVPVFMADVKGDLSGISVAGSSNPKLEERATVIDLTDYAYKSFPVIFWDVFGEKGHQLRTTISEMGPLLLSRLMDLSDAQEGVLNIAFKLADDEGLLLLDLKDLRSMLTHLAENADAVKAEYGLVTTASIGAIQRELLVLEQQGAELFFGEPALQLEDLMRVTTGGHGAVSILAADKLMQNPRLYSTFLLWLLSELFEQLPEVGDPDKPKLVFFFDEAHLLFSDAPKALVEKVEQVVRLIRSKGVGVYFVTQNPLDIPESILSQLGNRFQHALRAYTPRETKAVDAAADTFRPNPAFSCKEVITQLGVGEALVSTLEKKGIPSIVQKTLIRPPMSRLGPAAEGERAKVMSSSPVGAIYDKQVDRESAYELLAKRAEAEVEAEPEQRGYEYEPVTTRERPARRSGGATRQSPKKPAKRRTDSAMSAAMKSTVRSAGTQVGREIGKQFGRQGATLGGKLVRGLLGSLFKGR